MAGKLTDTAQNTAPANEVLAPADNVREQQQHNFQRQELRDTLLSCLSDHMEKPPRTIAAFQDILSSRIETTGDLMWVSREWKPQPVCQQTAHRSPAQIRRDVMSSPRIQHIIEEMSTEQNIPQEQLWIQLHEILDEMGQTQTMPVVRWFGFALSKIMRRIYKGVYVNEESIARLKSSIGDNPVLFMPSHRSYADFLLMSYVCFHYNITLPVIAAGMDFVAMWGIGRLLRDSGAFFIRRSFGSDRLYWAAFSEYVQSLVTAGDAPLEFFVEGTRSRSAKSLSPKLGLFSVALEPFFNGQVYDILVVPINISYDRTLEETLYAYELLGVPKPRESTSGLLKALNMLDEQYGRIHVDFTTPISIRQCCGDLRAAQALQPLHLPYEPSPEIISRVVKLAHHVVRQQQQNAVISVFSLAALAISSRMCQRRAVSIPLSELIREVAWLRSVTETLGALVDIRVDIESAVHEALHTHKSLVQLCSNNSKVQLRNVHTPHKSIDTAQMRGHTLGSVTLKDGVPVFMLQHYINQTLYLLVNPAIVTLALQHSAVNGRASRVDIFTKYKFLRTLFSQEFALYKAWDEKDFDATLRQLDLLHIAEVSENGTLVLGNHRKLQTLLVHLLSPFLGGYLACCHSLIKLSLNAPVNTSQILQDSQHLVEKRLGSNELVHHYCLSLDLLSACIYALSTMGALIRSKDNSGKAVYQGNEEKLRYIASTLEEFLVVHQNQQPEVHVQDMSEEHVLVHQEKAKL